MAFTGVLAQRSTTVFALLGVNRRIPILLRLFLNLSRCGALSDVSYRSLNMLQCKRLIASSWAENPLYTRYAIPINIQTIPSVPWVCTYLYHGCYFQQNHITPHLIPRTNHKHHLPMCKLPHLNSTPSIHHHEPRYARRIWHCRMFGDALTKQNLGKRANGANNTNPSDPIPDQRLPELPLARFCLMLVVPTQQ